MDKFPHPQTTAIKELLPMCWRSALTQLSAYLLARSMTLVAAQVLDLRATASLGLCMQFGFALAGVSQSWLAVKYPTLIQLRTKRDEAGLRRVVHQRMAMSLATYAAGAVVILVAAPYVIHLIGSRTPLLPTPIFAALLGVLGMDLYMGLNTSTMISENRVRYMVPFLISGLATLAFSVVMGRWLGLVGIIVAPFVVQLCWNYWWTPMACWEGLRLKTATEIEATELEAT